MADSTHLERWIIGKKLGTAHAFINALLPTLELNKLCDEYDDSIVYALSGIPFFYSSMSDNAWQRDSIGFVEDLLYHLKLEFEIISGFGGVYNKEYFESRIHEHLYLRKPIIARLCASGEWIQINAFDQVEKALIVKSVSCMPERLDDWYHKVDHIVLYTYPAFPYAFDPDWICSSIRQTIFGQEIDHQPIDQKQTSEYILLDTLKYRLTVLDIRTRLAARSLTKLARYRKDFCETENYYQMIIDEIQACRQALHDAGGVDSHLYSLFSLERSAFSSLVHWLDIYAPQGARL